MKVRDCFEAADWGYVVEARIHNPLHNLTFPEGGRVLFKVDTGFNGPIIVTRDIFESLRLPEVEVPDDRRPNYATLGGGMTMRSAPAILEVDGKQFETDIFTPLMGLSRLLIGFQILKQLNVALLGKKACFAKHI